MCVVGPSLCFTVETLIVKGEKLSPSTFWKSKFGLSGCHHHELALDIGNSLWCPLLVNGDHDDALWTECSFILSSAWFIIYK